ncbi:MAG TPA: GlsB/YeaQ/YmgE family stress response membrane protein [Actinomycetota bacterium]|nr:GlsB/YeaQ/YmgE family stress response membrane protein [Actinomycetota bacterium]
MLGLVLWLIVFGAIAGFVARLIVPGRDPIGFWGTVLLGIIGSFVGGLLASFVFEHTLALQPSGLVGSIIGAVVALLVYRATTRGRLARH